MTSSSAAGSCTELHGSISEDTYLYVADGPFMMTSQVFVQEGATLYVEAGTTIYAVTAAQAVTLGYADAAPALVVLPGGAISATGTATAPITFTSNDVSPGQERGLWGGLIIMGDASVYGGTDEVEGITGYYYGGTDDDDNSGTLSYVRVWHGGAVIGADNEINGITFAGVGSATSVDHIEVAYNLDDGIEFFGGTVNVKYASVLFVGDDAIDTDMGFQGMIQFAYIMIGSGGHHGAEMDSKIDKTPRSFPQVYNALWVGHLSGSAASVSSDDQQAGILRLREGTGGSFGNNILTNVGTYAIYQNDCGSEIRTQELTDDLAFPDYLYFSTNNIVDGPGSVAELASGCEGISTALRIDPVLTVMPGTFDHTDEVDPSTIKTISGDLTAAYSNLDDWPVDPFWTTVNYKGPFGDPLEDGDMWLDGWSWLSDNDVLLIQTVEDTQGTTEVIEEYAWYVWVSIGVGALIGCAVSGKMMQSVGLTSGFKAGYQKAKDEDLTNIMTPAMEVQMSPRTQQMKITGGVAAPAITEP